jgi:carnitine 3-dehydrogenase
MRPQPTDVTSVSLIGTGLIGGSWATHFLARGYDVIAWDAAPDGEARLRAFVADAWPSVERLGLAPGAGQDRLTMAASLPDAVCDAAIVIENTPERFEIKTEVLAAIDMAAPVEAIITSSTSGSIGLDVISAEMCYPDRFLGAHPFHPPHLIPLVTIAGSTRTAPSAIDWAASFFEAAGKSVVVMEREVLGYIANRLQEAMWREALHMVSAGEASPEQIDQAVTEGPGLRWPFMGPFLTYHVGAGPGGIAEQFRRWSTKPEMPYCRMANPPLTDELVDEVIRGCQAIAGERSYEDLVHERDRKLVAVMLALRDY